MFLLLLLQAVACQARADEPAYVDFLLKSAREQALYRDPYWLTLLHYKDSLLGSRSLVDDPAFFLAPDGKRDPWSEMAADIRGFFQEGGDQERHPVCRFVARYAWLKEKLHLDPARLPVAECGPFEDLLEKVKPESASLIFPTSHINSPASMFGHTLLTIETAYKSKLLSYAVNYSAVTTDTFGPLFAIKGLGGFYKGYFSILPYYAKIQEYSDVDRRDIWEYPLDLDREEVERLLMHVYELKDIYSDYYFLDENCSYDLLFLLDAARPTLHLTDQCRWWVIPLDTIKVAEQNGLIKDAVFRPSQTTKIRYVASLLPKGGREKALRIARGELAPEAVVGEEIPAEEKRRIFDLGMEYLQYRYIKKALPKETYQERFLKTLQARSLLGGTDGGPYPVPTPEKPEEGHDSNRFSLGFGTLDDDLFQEIRYRPAYHALVDDGKGFKEGAQIVFFDAAARYYYADERFELEKLDVIDIVSLAPRDDLFRPVSWKIKTGLERILTEDGERDLVYDLNLGGGFSYKLKRAGLWYILGETDFIAGGGLETDYAAGVGGSTGLIKDLNDVWRVYLYARDVYYGLGDTHNVLRAGLLQNFAIRKDMSLTAEVSREKAYDEYQTEAVLHWNLFF